MTKNQPKLGNQPNPSTMLYPCSGGDCDGKEHLEEDMARHSSGAITKYCKSCMNILKVEGRKNAKAKNPQKREFKLKEGSYTSRVLDILKSFPADSGGITPKELRDLIDPRRKMYSHLVTDCLSTLIKRGEAKKSRKGRYTYAGEMKPLATAIDEARRVVKVKTRTSKGKKKYESHSKVSEEGRAAILAELDIHPQKVFFIDDLIRLHGGCKSRVFDTLKFMVAEGEVLRMSKGEYMRGGKVYSGVSEKRGAEVEEEMRDLNSALTAANNTHDSLKMQVFLLADAFEAQGKEVSSIFFKRGKFGKVESYVVQYSEQEEVVR